MSNNETGPVILQNLANDAAQPGYYGTGGRTGAQSTGPVYTGGLTANLPLPAAVPAGSLYLDQNTSSMWQNLGQNTWVQRGASATSVTADGVAVISANPMILQIAGAAVGDLALATIQTDDTGGTLGGIIGCLVTAPDTVTLTFTNAPTNNDARVVAVTFGQRTNP